MFDNFKSIARVNGLFASGNTSDGFRVAVRNVTGYKHVVAVVQFNCPDAFVSERPTAYPTLVHITRKSA